jgi:hypothetical protein
MFESWQHGVVFALIATFFTGLIASIFAKYNLKTKNN